MNIHQNVRGSENGAKEKRPMRNFWLSLFYLIHRLKNQEFSDIIIWEFFVNSKHMCRVYYLIDLSLTVLQLYNHFTISQLL